MEKQHQKELPRKVTKTIRGQMREYNFLKSVNSLEELDNCRFKNYCHRGPRKPLPNFESHTMPCLGRYYKPRKQCDFELLALRLADSCTIDIYAHGEHTHPILSEENRARRAKELMPVENPPRIFRTPDSIEWTFLQTFADFDQMHKFRYKSQCHCKYRWRKNYQRIRFPCNLKNWRNCQFTLLALKTTSAGYHVYKLGEHNHPVKPRKKQQPAAACGHQQKQQGMEVDEKDKEEDDEDDQQENEVEKEGEEENDEDDVEEEDEKQEGSSVEKIIENPLENESNPREANPRVETLELLEERLQKAIAKVYKWMVGIEPTQIGTTLGGWDNSYLLKFVEIADQEIRDHPEKFDFWRPFLKCAIKKCMSEMEDFGTKYKDLIIRMVEHD